MNFLRVAVVATALMCPLFSSASPPQPPERTDALGRVVQDADSHRITYATNAAGFASLASAATQNSGASHAPRSKAQSVRAMASTSGPNYVEQWRLVTWGSGIGGTGIWPVDVNNDGSLEFVLGGGTGFSGNQFWSIVGYDSASHGYQILWQSPIDTSSGISALRVVQTAGTKRVWVGRSNGTIDVVNALTRETVATLTTGSAAITDFAIADADNDGTLDVVALSGTALFIYDPTTLALVRTINYGGDRLAVGDIDGHGTNEIVLNTGYVIEVTSASTVLKWQTSAFGFSVGLADIDGDGKQELIAAQSWYHIVAWDLDLHSPKWDHPTSINIDAMRLIDVTGDGHPEVLYGDGQWGAIHALSADTGSELWHASNPDHGVTDIAVFDANHDGRPELLWGAGWSTTGPDYLHVHDLATLADEWTNIDFEGPFDAVDVGDVDADGQPELVTASYRSDSGYGDGLISVYDASTHALKWQSSANTLNGFAWTGIHALHIANVDADPQPEILVATDRLYDGALFIIDGKTHLIEHQYVFDTGAPLSALDVADLNGDGKPTIVAGNSIAHTGATGVYIYVINPSDGAVVWKSPGLTSTSWGGVSQVVVADVGSPGIDILAVAGPVYRIRWSDKQQIATTATNYSSVMTADVTGSGRLQIIAGRSDGAIELLDGDTLASLSTYNGICSQPITALHAHGPHTVALTCGSTFMVYDLGSRSIVTQTVTSNISLGAQGSLVRTTINDKAAYLVGGNSALELLDVGGDHVPTIHPISQTLHWRSSIDITLAASDSDGDALSFEITDLPSKGSVTWVDRAAGTLRYIGDGRHTGSDSFQARASDGFQYSPAQPISLSLTNTAPLATTAALSFHWRGAQSAQLGGRDADGDPLTFTIATNPASASITLTNASTGEIEFVPAGNTTGTDSLTYQVADGVDSSAAQTVTVSLTNTPPTAAGTRFDITPNTTIYSQVNGQDADGDPLTYATVQQPTQGKFTLDSSTGLFQYAPASGGSGTDTVTVTVNDGVSQSQAVSLEFRYSASNSGGGGGGGRLEWLTLLTLVAALGYVSRARRRADRDVEIPHGV